MTTLNHDVALRFAGISLAAAIAAASFATACLAQDKTKQETQVIEKRVVIRHVGDKDTLKPGEVPPVPVPGEAVNCPGQKFVVDSAGGTEAKKEQVKFVLCADKDEEMLAALQKAETDIQKQEDIPADRKAEILAKIRDKIAELRAKG